MKKTDIEKLKNTLTELNKILKPVFEKIKDYQALNYRTPDEEKELEKLLNLVKNVVPVYAAASIFFGNQAFISAVSYYNQIKQLAEKGDPQACEIVKELAPLYKEALLSQLDNN